MKLKTNLLRILFVLTLCGLMTVVAFAADVPTFTASNAVFELIEYYEGFEETCYCDAGVAYIGYGSRFTDAVSMFGENCEPITKEQAKQLTRQELEESEGYLNNFLRKNNIVINQNQFDALMDFTYNCGIGWFINDRAGDLGLLKKMILDAPSTWTQERITAAFRAWIRDANGNELPGLKKRRDSEIDLFTAPVNNSGFTDVTTGTWYYDYVVAAKELGIMVGNGNGTFSPEKTLTRAEMVQLLAGYAGADLTAVEASDFSDVKAGAWYAGAVAWAEENGYVRGYPDGTFRPDAEVTREDFCAILARYLRKQDVSYSTKDVTFPDEDEISDYAREDAVYCASIGLVSGTDGGRFAPKAGTKRAEAAAIMVRLVQLG